MNETELQKAMDESFFARCVWQEEDLNDIDGIEQLPPSLYGDFMYYISSTLEDIMTMTGWEVLNTGLANFLRDRGIAEE